jgi:hypothetical protein
MLAVKKNACGFYLPQQQWKVKNNVGYYLSSYQDITYLCYFVGIFTAGRDGKDGRGPMVQSFPLLSKGFGGLL